MRIWVELVLSLLTQFSRMYLTSRLTSTQVAYMLIVLKVRPTAGNGALQCPKQTALSK